METAKESKETREPSHRDVGTEAGSRSFRILVDKASRRRLAGNVSEQELV
jgi:hypothetical protein